MSSAKIDEILDSTGAMRKYQWLQVTLVCLNNLTVAFHFLVIVFHSITPDHRCKIPGLENDTYSASSAKHNQSIYRHIPTDERGQLSSCEIYTGPHLNTTAECTEYVYSNEVYWGESLNMHFGMVCSRAFLSTGIKMVYTIGMIFGPFLIGMLADRFGRRPTIIVFLIFGSVCGVVAAFSVNIYMFAALRFIIAACFTGSALLAHCIMMEVTGPSRRHWSVSYKSTFWPMGAMYTSLIAYYVQDWNWVQLTGSIPPLVVGLIMIPFLKETPHFLVTKGRHEEAKEVFETMARMNQAPFNEEAIEELKNEENKAVKEKAVAIFYAPLVLKRTAVFLLLWFTAGLGYYGLNFNVANLTGSIYINNLISGAVEIPAALLFFISQYLGRKSLSVTSLFIGSLSLISVAVMSVYFDLKEANIAAVSISVAMIGKFALTSLFTFAYFWSSEVFPTTLRTTLVGLCSLSARVGSSVSPLIVDLYNYIQTPFKTGFGPLIFGIVMAITGVAAIYLPETRNTRIPETIEQANHFMVKSKRKLSADDYEDLEMVDREDTKA